MGDSGREVSRVFIDVEKQYDRIYRYCYFKLHNRETAEDVTQETFLRYFERYRHITQEQALRCLYTIAGNLCIDEFRRRPMETLEEARMDGLLQEESGEERILTGIQVSQALDRLLKEEQEILLLRYVNEVPVTVIGHIMGLSRFAAYRRLAAAAKKFREAYDKSG